ncbi:hypothetical protein [Segetibacter koreensis]|uniref:hypothetical protein n=1 Tax=Segetibacter koreensis TaxID=398037 RepID=UPI00037AFF64|nr:hypothetical protein [Segetibacter koreensis]
MVIITKYIKRRSRERLSRKTIAIYAKLIALLGREIDVYDTIATSLNEEFSLQTTPPLINNFMFFNLAFRDIIGTVKQLISLEGEEDKNLPNRVLAHQLYEYLEKTKALLGGKFKDSLSGMPDEVYLVKQLNRLKEYNNAIHKYLYNHLREIRHNTLGHMDRDAIKVNRLIKTINSNDLINSFILIFMLYALIRNFHNTIIYTIRTHLVEESQNTAVIAEITPPETRIRGVDAEFKRIHLIIREVDPRIAEFVCDLSPEYIKKLQELSEFLNNKEKG